MSPVRGAGPNTYTVSEPDGTVALTVTVPEMALSPAGRQLYVTHGGDDPQLIVIDTQNGLTVKSIAIEHRGITPVHTAIPTIEVSPNGQWVFMKKSWTTTPHLDYTDDYSIAVYDTERGVIDKEIELDKDCGATLMFAARADPVLHVVCMTSNMVRSYDFSGSAVLKVGESPAGTHEIWPETAPRSRRIRTAAVSSDGGLVGLTGDGTIEF